jgi:hypothetical protein
MKKIFILLGVACLIIAGVMIYLVKTGVSLRTAPYIRPSLISADFLNVPESVFTRLFPDLQNAHYIVWGLPATIESQIFLEAFTRRYEAEFKTKVNVLANDSEDILNCQKPCWIFKNQDQAHQLAPNPWIDKNLKPIQKIFITLTWMDFYRHPVVPPHCTAEKRLDFECLPLVAIKDVERKFRERDKRYFFMRKYQDQDFFLFLEKPHQ